MGQYFHICRQPLRAIQLPCSQPPEIRMLAQLQLTTQQTAHIAPHAQMEAWVVPFNGIQQLAHFHLHAQFLGYFPGNRIPRRLTRLNLATRKLPSTTMLVLRAFHRQHTPLGIQNKGCHYLHNSQILAHALTISYYSHSGNDY